MQKSIKFWFSKRNHTASFILSHIGKSLCFDFNLKQQRGLRERCRIGKPPAAIFIQGGIYMNQTTQTQPVNRLYKSRIFAMLYSDRKDLLDLYNAVSGKHYEDPELLEIFQRF